MSIASSATCDTRRLPAPFAAVAVRPVAALTKYPGLGDYCPPATCHASARPRPTAGWQVREEDEHYIPDLLTDEDYEPDPALSDAADAHTDDSAEVPEALRPCVAGRASRSGMLGVSEVAELLNVSRTTVYDWVEKGILLGWKSTKRGLTIPAEQILRPGKVIPGIARVIEIIDDPELAWAFLSQEWPFADRAGRPIDRLKAGKVEDVVTAAPSFGTAVT